MQIVGWEGNVYPVLTEIDNLEVVVAKGKLVLQLEPRTVRVDSRD